ncbi:MAG TPA: hypothetical protein PKE12_07255 [Kiritimatiellia bacterium]|nr:hypothetical protein [Kiritimatiellia bacterium]
MQVRWSTARDIHHNLALEEWWVDHFDARGPVLLFHVSDPALVVGKNQNPWREAATGWARREGVPVGRRISGGGTVFHDAGNLNFTLIQSRNDYEQGAVFARCLAALRALGLEAGLLGGNSLAVHGKKISGTAFCFRGSAALHHGTMLVNADLDRLRRAMIPALPDIQTRAIPSKPASVANAALLADGIDMERVARSLAGYLAGRHDWDALETPSDDDFAELLARHQSWAWTFGHTPVFEWALESASATLRLHVEKGMVAGAVCAWCRDREESIDALIGCPFEADALSRRLAGTEWPALLAARDF